MEFLVFWLLFGIACGVIANVKGRSVAGWIALGFIGGLISLIILLCLKKIVAMKKCPKCANEVKLEALVCHYCSHDFFVKEIQQ